MWEYKPSIDSWTPRANFPGGPRYNMSSVGVGVNAFVGLGTNFDTYMNDWWKYEVGTNSWEQQTNFPGGYRGGACAFSVVGKAFVACGTNGGPKADTYEFNPISGNWSPRSDYGGSERKQAVCFVIGNRAFLGTGSGTGGKKNSMYEYVSLYTAGIEEIENQIAVYPTISSETIHIDFPVEYSYYTLSILNQTGQVVSNQSLTSNAFELHRNGLPAGNYFLEFNSNDGMPKLQRRIIFVD
jgi:N-acetylneuraminic acid mutarotase